MIFQALTVAAGIALATPVVGYSISIDRSDRQTDSSGAYHEEIVEVRGQNNRSLSEAQIDGARDAGYEAACKKGENKLLDVVDFSDGVVILEIVCSAAEG